MKLRLPFLALSLLLVLNACVRENSAPSEPATFEPGEGAVFLTSVPFEDAMTAEDFPNSERDGSGEAAVVWQDRLLVRSTNHIFEYDWEGNLLAYSDSALVPMARDMALIGDSLFVASWEEGIYEVDLTSNRVVNFYDAEDGLENVQNLQFAVDGETLWVGTFQGVAQINTTTDEIRFYQEELNIEGGTFSANVYTNEGDVWAEVLANAGSEGGVSHYDSRTDTWTAYGPTAFLGDRSAERVDFLSFVVSDEGVFAAFQENGPSHEILKKFNSAQNTWDTVFESSAETFMSILPSKLPAPESYSSSSYDDIAQTVSIFDGGTWKTIPAPTKTYAAIVHEGDAYYLLSSSGIERFSKGDSFPEVIGASDLMFGFNPPAFFLTEDERYLVFFAPQMNEMAGSWAYMDAGAYDLQTSNFFSTHLDLSTLSYEELPTASDFVFPAGQTQFPFGKHQMVLDLTAHSLTLQ